MTHSDRAGDPSGPRAGRREAAGPAGHRQGLPTPSPIRPLPVRLTAAFGLGQMVGPIVAGYGFDLTGSFLVSSLVAAVGLCISAALTVVVGRS